MLERKIMSNLLEWKNKKDKMCMVIKGARQVGKTYIVEKFAKNNYKNFIKINFVENPSYKSIFEKDLDVETIIKQITLNIPNSKLIPNETLIFLDEIQNCPNARTALKFLTQDRRFDVIASGSLLGINYEDVTSFPVGYVETVEMYSLDFEEFLWANGIDKSAIEYLKELYDKCEEIPNATHNKMMELFKEYIVVGGMPRVVANYVENHNFNEVLKIQKEIINNYLEDIAKYAKNTEKAKARACFLSIPKHLAKDYKKFRYSLVSQGGTSRKYEGSLMWLYDAGIISFCHNLSRPELPLEGNSVDEQFKVYMNDTGLLVSMLDDGSNKDIIDGNLGIYKGALFENIIAEIFTKNNKKLYYFEYNNQLEIDFMTRIDNKLTAIEVKSADNTKSKSLNSLMERWNVKNGIRLSTKKIGASENIKYIPLYMAIFLK